MKPLTLPLIVAPMFLVSGPELVLAAIRAGVVGAFPTLNARTTEILESWLRSMREEEEKHAFGTFAVNLVVSKHYRRYEDDLAAIVRHRAPVCITSIGDPTRAIDRVHSYGGLVMSDVASVKHARRAVDAGVDGLILLCAGAGGNTGWLNPFAFVPEVRSFFAGPLAVAGCISSGRALRAIRTLGADFGYAGTAFIAAEESLAADGYKDALVASGADDIMLTDVISGIPANLIRKSVEMSGALGAPKATGLREIVPGVGILPAGHGPRRPWRDLWAAGQGAGSVGQSEQLGTIVSSWRAEYDGGQPSRAPAPEVADAR